MTAGR